MIPGAHAHLRWVAAVAALGVSGDADAGQVRGQLVAADVAVLRQLRKWGNLADGEVMGPTPAAGNDGLPNHSTRQRGAAVRAGIVENRPSELSVGMLPPRQ